MKNYFLTFLIVSLTSALSFAVDPATPKMDTGMDPKMQEMMKKAQEMGKPGPEHKVLSDLAGDWTYKSKFWHEPNGKPEETTGTSKLKMIMGGRWLQQDIKGKAMGMPFEGMGLTGYDRVKKEYQTMFIDNMGTSAAVGKGTFDTAAKTLKETGSYSCPITEKERGYRAEWKILDKNNMAYSMYGTKMDGTGPEFKTMEITYKRK